MIPSVFFKTLKSKFNVAAKNKIISKAIQVGDFTIKMNFLNADLLPIFYHAFLHLSVDPTTLGQPSLTLNFWDGESTGSFIEDTPLQEHTRDHLGLIDALTKQQFYTLQQPGSDAIYMLDVDNNEGFYWVPAVSRIPWWESDFPLRMVFHWWFANTSFQPIHAAAVGTEKGGVLLVGKGGSGKSTSTLFCINSILKIAGDDYVLLDCKEKFVYSLFSLTKLSAQSLEMLTNINIDVTKLNDPIEDKYRINLYPNYKDSLIKKMPVVAVLLPTITQNENTFIEPCAPGDAMLALSPTTLFQLPGLRQRSFKKMSDFIKSIPSYRLLLGKDASRLPQILDHFISSHSLS